MGRPIQITGKYDDDPPIFAVRISRHTSARRLRMWLRLHRRVRQVELEIPDGANLQPSDVEDIAQNLNVSIRIVGTGTAQSQ